MESEDIKEKRLDSDVDDAQEFGGLSGSFECTQSNIQVKILSKHSFRQQEEQAKRWKI